MAPVNYKIIDNKKYMWDGKEYVDEGEALKVVDIYKKDKFEVQLIQKQGEYFIYTRRVAGVTTPSS